MGDRRFSQEITSKRRRQVADGRVFHDARSERGGHALLGQPAAHGRDAHAGRLEGTHRPACFAAPAFASRTAWVIGRQPCPGRRLAAGWTFGPLSAISFQASWLGEPRDDLHD